MMIFNNFNSQRFTFNGIQYFKNYISKVAGNQISVFNAYDRKDVLVDWVHFGGVTVNGVTFGNVADLQSALLPVIYTRSTLGNDGGGAETFLELTDTPSTYLDQAGKYPKVKDDETGLEFGDAPVPTLQEVTEVENTTNTGLVISDGASISFMSSDDDPEPSDVVIDNKSLLFQFDDFSSISIQQGQIDMNGVSGGATQILPDGMIRSFGSGMTTKINFENVPDIGNGQFTIPNLEGEQETAATREWVTANVSGGAVDSVNGETGVVVLDASDVGAEPALGFTPEDVANKATNLTSPDNTKYPTTEAVATALNSTPLVIISDTNKTSLTGSTANTIHKTYLIPAATLTDFNALFITVSGIKQNNTGNGRLGIWGSPTSNFADAFELSRVNAAAVQSIGLHKIYELYATTIEGLTGTSALAPIDPQVVNAPKSMNTWNRANDFYLFVVTLANSNTEVYGINLVTITAFRTKTTV